MEECTRLILIRHGETQNAHLNCYNGHNDIGLTDNGKQQINGLKRLVDEEDIETIYSSDLKRTIIGAEILATHLGLKVIKDKRIKEICYGRWEGLPLDEIKRLYPDEVKKRFQDLVNYRVNGGGENLLDLRARVIPAISETIQKHKNTTVCIVAHGGVNRAILGWALNMDVKDIFRIKQNFAAYNIINIYKENALVELVNGRVS